MLVDIESGRRGVYGDATVPSDAIVTEDETVFVDGCQAYTMDGFDSITLRGPGVGAADLAARP